VIPITFLGATYYAWERLGAIPWLKVVVLANPLVYMSEGFRIALLPAQLNATHMPTPAMYAALIGYTLLLGWVGVEGFRKRVQS